jgi:uncharacterized membrane protein SpoIIM required for sporulation
MNLDAFLREREPSWRDLDVLVDRAGRRPERLPPADVLALGALYRAAAADLARARRGFPGDPVLDRLADLVGRARHLVYDVEPRRETLWSFVTTGYWRRVRERPVPLLIAWCLLLTPAVLAFAWALRDPARASGLVPGAYRAVSTPRPHGAHLGLPVAVQTALASTIFTHNIQVALFAFAGGIAAGLVTAFVLLQNGLQLGVVGGLAASTGHGSLFAQLVMAHGVLELSCIAVAAAAGLRVGWALVDPGRRRRVDALATEARGSIEIALGTAPWLVVAGIVEGYITPRGLGLGPVLAIGIGLGGLYWSLVLWRGRPAPSVPRDAGA